MIKRILASLVLAICLFIIAPYSPATGQRSPGPTFTPAPTETPIIVTATFIPAPIIITATPVATEVPPKEQASEQPGSGTIFQWLGFLAPFFTLLIFIIRTSATTRSVVQAASIEEKKRADALTASNAEKERKTSELMEELVRKGIETGKTAFDSATELAGLREKYAASEREVAYLRTEVQELRTQVFELRTRLDAKSTNVEKPE